MELVLKLENFEGPLDLLLHLIEKKKLNIADIKISQIIDEYLNYIERAKADKLEIKIEFLEIASELLEIKVLAILSAEEKKEKEKKLKQRWEADKVIKEIAKAISDIECEDNISYSRKEGKKVIKTIPKEYDLRNLKIQDVFTSFMKYLPKDEEMIQIEIEKKYSLLEEMDKIKISLFSSDKTVTELFSKAENRTHLVYMFLAILDLYREGFIDLEGERMTLLRRNSEV